jgi:2-dehydropantoate 2-reductase
MRIAERPIAAPMKWSKLLTNLIANASGAILDMDAQDVYRDPRLFDIERRQLLETLAVMRGLGFKPVSIPGAPVPWLARCTRLPAWLGRPILVRIVGGARAGKAPSLLLHLRSAPPDAPISEQTEVDWMNGAVVRAGAEVGVLTPVNARLAALVDAAALDPERRAWFRHNPERLVDAVTAAAAATTSLH